MPTLSEMNEHAADAEHHAFQRAYDALLDIAKDPITCRHFWDAGFTAGQADANDMLTVAHMDGYAKGRESLRRELEGQEAVTHEFQDRDGRWHPFMNAEHRANTEKDGTWPIRALFARPIPPPDVKPVAYGYPNTAITGKGAAMMMVRLDIPSDDQYGGSQWVPLYTAPPDVRELVEAIEALIPLALSDCAQWSSTNPEDVPEIVAARVALTKHRGQS